MLKFSIVLYLMPNLTFRITYVKFDTMNGITLENDFMYFLLNYSIDTWIWYSINKDGKESNWSKQLTVSPIDKPRQPRDIKSYRFKYISAYGVHMPGICTNVAMQLQVTTNLSSS